MPQRDDFEREITLVRSLRELLSTYEELAVMHIGRVRGQVLATRAFRDGLFRVFGEVRAARRQELAALLAQRRRRVASARRREAAVLLSSNERLAGELTGTLLRRFTEYVDRRRPAGLAVAGTVGRDFLARTRADLSFTYFPLPKEHAPLREHAPLVRWLRDFDDVTIFYGKFVNVVDQVAATTKLSSEARFPHETTGGGLVALSRAARLAQRRDYLFEPELPAMFAFFDTQVFALLFQQTVSEATLALLGSRITAMERATTSIERRLGQLTAAALQVRKAVRNRKQRQALAGVSLWGG